MRLPHFATKIDRWLSSYFHNKSPHSSIFVCFFVEFPVRPAPRPTYLVFIRQTNPSQSILKQISFLINLFSIQYLSEGNSCSSIEDAGLASTWAQVRCGVSWCDTHPRTYLQSSSPPRMSDIDRSSDPIEISHFAGLKTERIPFGFGPHIPNSTKASSRVPLSVDLHSYERCHILSSWVIMGV